MSWIHIKENSKIICPFAHILMYTVLEVKPAYICDKGLKVTYGNLSMFLGMIKETSKEKKWSMGRRSLHRDREGHKSVIHHVW